MSKAYVRGLSVLSISLFVVLTCSTDAFAAPEWIERLMPKYKPGSDVPTLRKTDKPSMLARFNTRTKAVVEKSKEIMPDWLVPDSRAKKKKSSKSVVRNASSRINKEIRSAKRNTFAPWKKSRVPDKPPTLSDWLAQPRPEY